MSRKHDRETEQSLIRWRRKQVAELWFSGEDVKTIAEKLKVSPRTIYADQEYIENHADDLMKNYIVKTVPHIINKSIYQIDLANKTAISIMRDEGSDRKEKLQAALAVAKTARDVVEIIAGNKGIVDKALELDSSLSDQQNEEEVEEEVKEEEEEEEDQDNELLSGDSTETEESEEDPERVF